MIPPDLSNGETRLDLGSHKNFKLLTQLGGGNRNQRSASSSGVFFSQSGTFALPGVEPLSRANEKPKKNRD